VNHRIFQPSASDPLNFESTVEQTLRDLCSRFSVRAIHFDPWQMAAVAQRLRSAGLPMCEFAQSVPNLTVIGSNLFELIKGQNIVVYPDDAIRLAISRTVAKETARGFQLTKEKQSHKIDVVIALAMCARACVEQGQSEVPFVASDWIGVHVEPRVGVPGAYAGSSEDLAYATTSRGLRGNGGLVW
jgi:phage terminase large subunit-like protein